MSYYIIVLHNAKYFNRVYRILKKHSEDIVAVAILVSIRDPRILGGIKVIDSDNIELLRGFMPLPKQK